MCVSTAALHPEATGAQNRTMQRNFWRARAAGRCPRQIIAVLGRSRETSWNSNAASARGTVCRHAKSSTRGSHRREHLRLHSVPDKKFCKEELEVFYELATWTRVRANLSQCAFRDFLGADNGWLPSVSFLDVSQTLAGSTVLCACNVRCGVKHHRT